MADDAPLSAERRDTRPSYPSSSYQRPTESYNGNADSSYKDLPTQFGSSRTSHEKPTRRDYERLEEMMKNQFEKKFFFRCPSDGWTLPNPGVMFQNDKWKIKRFQELKKELNCVKNKLNGYNLDEWHKHTRSMNKAGEIQWKLKREFEPEFVTQAWCKFYENACAFKLVPSSEVVNSVHLCEAPGAFVTSLNHYLKLRNPDVKWNWIATTLNPYYEGNPLSCMINDDRFILQTIDHWCFGRDFTGDLMNLKNLQHLMKETKAMGDIHLVTADGSIDCQEEPGEQEAIVSSLHYCETVSALHLLAEGGSFLLKMFTMFEQETICLMYLLNCVFENVNVFKPATSKEGNSEVYVVCLGYKGKEFTKQWRDVLRTYFGPEPPSKAMFPEECIPGDFVDQLYKCAQTFKRYQVDVIENNIRAFRRGRDPFIRKLRYMISNRFMELYNMSRLDESLEVVGKSKLEETQTLNLDPRTEEGSYNDRVKKKTLSPLETLKYIEEDLLSMDIKWPYEEDIKWLEFPPVIQGFKIITGKPVTTVHSSKFCLGRLLQMRNRVRGIAQKLSSLAQPEFHALKRAESQVSCVSQPDDNPLIQMLDMSPKEIAEMKKLNFKEDLWSSLESGQNQEAELRAFDKIKDTVDSLWREQNLFIQGYPMLTQFNVGIIYMLSHMFTKVGFIKPNQQNFAVVFVGYLSWKVDTFKFLDEVDTKFDELYDAGGNESVLALMPIYQLCGKRPEIEEKQENSRKESVTDIEKYAESVSAFYTCVTEVNHLCVKEQILDIIDKTKH